MEISLRANSEFWIMNSRVWKYEFGKKNIKNKNYKASEFWKAEFSKYEILTLNFENQNLKN